MKSLWVSSSLSLSTKPLSPGFPGRMMLVEERLRIEGEIALHLGFVAVAVPAVFLHDRENGALVIGHLRGENGREGKKGEEGDQDDFHRRG